MKNKIIFKKPNREPMIKEVDEITLEMLQKMVEGWIEAILPFENSKFVMILNEEGKINGLEPNLNLIYDTIVGNVVIIKADGEDFTGLNDDEIKEALQYLKETY